jgi:hypothetical protein
METVTVTLNGSLGAKEFLIIGDDIEGWTEYLQAGAEGAAPVAVMLAAASILLRKARHP